MTMVMAIKVITVVIRTPIIKMMGNTTISMKDIMTINNSNIMEEKVIMMNRKNSLLCKSTLTKIKWLL